MARTSLFLSHLEKEKLDDWGVGYDICPDCGAKALERQQIVPYTRFLRKDAHEKLSQRTLV
jgi:hypothetical protein